MSIPKFKIFLHFLLFLLPTILCDKDLYKILEIKRDATQNEIKHKYRQLSRIYHPDKNRSPEAAEKYKEINEAYEILSDTKKRRLYDRGGMDAVNRDGQMEGHDPFDIFDIFTGGAHRRARQDRNRGEDMRVKIRASLKDLYMGKEYEFTYTRYAMCPHCRGSGADSYEDVETCDKCNGQGVYMETKRLGPGFIQQIQKTCPKCGGRGKMIKKECHECHGKKIVQSLEEMTLFIEKGMENGSEIKFEEFGEEKPDKDPGHLIFIVEELPDKVFKREKDNLRVDMVISLKEALIGFNREIIHLDGHKVPIKKNTVSQPGEVIRIKKEGMPIHNKGDSGDLLVTLKIKFPDKLTEQQKDKLYQFFNKRSYW